MISRSLPIPTSPSLNPNHHSRHTTSIAQPRDSITFESLKSRLIRHADVGHIDEAIATLDLMSRSSLSPDLTTYSVLLKSCIRTRNFELGRTIHSKLIDSGLELDVIVLNSLISLYSKCGDWRKAEEIFSTMGGLRDLVSWSAMISGYAHVGFNLEALLLFFEMVGCGERPNQFCFSDAIRACSNREFARIGLTLADKLGLEKDSRSNFKAEYGQSLKAGNCKQLPKSTNICLKMAAR